MVPGEVDLQPLGKIFPLLAHFLKAQQQKSLAIPGHFLWRFTCLGSTVLTYRFKFGWFHFAKE
jgi:hypothetical protein